MPASKIARRLLAGLIGSLSGARWRKVDARASRLRKTDGDSLLGGARTVLALADMVYFFADKFTRLRRWRLAGFLVGTCAI